MTREQMENMLALDGWVPFKRYQAKQLRNGKWRTTSHPVVLTSMAMNEKKAPVEPLDWSAIPDPWFRKLFVAVYREERKWR